MPGFTVSFRDLLHREQALSFIITLIHEGFAAYIHLEATPTHPQPHTQPLPSPLLQFQAATAALYISFSISFLHFAWRLREVS